MLKFILIIVPVVILFIGIYLDLSSNVIEVFWINSSGQSNLSPTSVTNQTPLSPSVAPIPAITKREGKTVINNWVDLYMNDTIGTSICRENLNTDPPTTKVNYVNKEKGFSLDFPYNPNWGNDKYVLEPYRITDNPTYIAFGHLRPIGICLESQASLIIVPNRSIEDAIKGSTEDEGGAECRPAFQRMMLEDKTVLKYLSNVKCGIGGNPVIKYEVIGIKSNYGFAGFYSSENVKIIEDTIKSMKFILELGGGENNEF